jgi:hypothetical protein
MANRYDPAIRDAVTTSLFMPWKAGKRAAWRFVDRRRWARAAPRFAEAWPAIDSITGWTSEREAQLLFTLAGLVRPGHAIVEIGSYEGRSTAALASGAHAGVPIYAVDPHTGCRVEVEQGISVNTWPAFIENLERTGSTAVVPVRSTSVEAARSYDGPSVELLYVDGWHSTDAVIADHTSWRPHCVRKPIIVFVDVRHSVVIQAIETLADHLPRRIGIVGKDVVFADELPPRIRRLIEHG